jgi:asparagine synthase (glutamine-hydrolysing)
MCGITGIMYEQTGNTENIERMVRTLEHRGPDTTQYMQDGAIQLGHTRLAIIDVKDGQQPMQRTVGDETYTLVYNGELYNTDELRGYLVEQGYHFTTRSDTEVLLFAFIHWGIESVERLNGIFAFAVYMHREKKLFVVRDRFGVKPLFYSYNGGVFLFASEIKALLAHPLCTPIVNKEGLASLLTIGPSRVPGKTVYERILELPPGHYLSVHNETLKVGRYYSIESKTHEDDLQTTIDTVEHLVTKAIQKQLVSDVPVCTFLSGGIDSSIISKVASDIMPKPLHTFSLEFLNNADYFKQNDFQVSADAPFVQQMVEAISSKHQVVTLQEEQLFDALQNSLKAKDYPSMADIDSSLYLFCEKIAKQFRVALSGECADELFGGYPWFARESEGFPWIQSINERDELLKGEMREKLNITETLDEIYNKAIEPVSHESKHHQLLYLNQMYFMQTLLERKDRMSMAHGLEVRVPFADHELVEYVFHIPHEMKRTGGVEKGLLRHAFDRQLPKDVLWRKKNPFPKTHNPHYTKLVQQELQSRYSDSQSILKILFDHESFTQLMKSGGASFKKPWFGQLMTGPQLLAYFIQLDDWFKQYRIQLVL